MIEASIVIPTYRRPEALRRAVASCLTQRGAGQEWEIVVVDNNPDGSARVVVEDMAAHITVPIRYVWETRPGISHARNAGVAASAGRYLIFLDDDEEAEPGWLAALLDTARDYGADVVVGVVRASFPPGCHPGEPYPSSQFTRDLGLTTGAPISWLAGIGNVLLRRETCIEGPEPFDPRFGLIGGEDALLMWQIERRGRKLVWCAEAIVFETVPENRLEPRFLLRRAFIRGQVTTFLCATLSLRAQTARMMAVGCVQALVFGVPALLLRAVNDRRWVQMMDRALLGVGKLLWHPWVQRSLYR